MKVHTLADLQSRELPVLPQVQQHVSTVGQTQTQDTQQQQPCHQKVLDVVFPYFSIKGFIFWISIFDIIVYIATCIYSHAPGNYVAPSVVALKAFGANVPELIRQGQIWRLFLPVFLHTGLIHLILNVVMQMRIGFMLEHRFGWPKIIAAYFTSGFAGNLVSAAVLFCGQIKAGASTALFGLMGIQMVDLLLNWSMVPDKLFVGGQLALFGFLAIVYSLGPYVDVLGHFGGFFAGAYFGLIFCDASNFPQRSYTILLWVWRIFFILAFVASSVLLFVVPRCQ